MVMKGHLLYEYKIQERLQQDVLDHYPFKLGCVCRNQGGATKWANRLGFHQHENIVTLQVFYLRYANVVA